MIFIRKHAPACNPYHHISLWLMSGLSLFYQPHVRCNKSSNKDIAPLPHASICNSFTIQVAKSQSFPCKAVVFHPVMLCALALHICDERLFHRIQHGNCQDELEFKDKRTTCLSLCSLRRRWSVLCLNEFQTFDRWNKYLLLIFDCPALCVLYLRDVRSAADVPKRQVEYASGDGYAYRTIKWTHAPWFWATTNGKNTHSGCTRRTLALWGTNTRCGGWKCECLDLWPTTDVRIFERMRSYELGFFFQDY